MSSTKTISVRFISRKQYIRVPGSVKKNYIQGGFVVRSDNVGMRELGAGSRTVPTSMRASNMVVRRSFQASE